MFYTVYKITNLIDGMVYIGCHQTSDLDDNYMGSGKYLKRAQKKYGIENFEKEILEVFDNLEDMFEMESKIVNSEFVDRDDTYNLKEGGSGGFDYLNSTGINMKGKNYAEISKMGVLAIKKKMENDVEFRNKQLDHLKKASEKAKIVNKLMWENGDRVGIPHSDETKKKMSEAKKGKYTGNNSSSFDTSWIYNMNLKESKKVPKADIEKWIVDGWIKGRKIDFSEKSKEKKIKPPKICKKCGDINCLRPDVCNKHQMVITMIDIFGLDKGTFGSNKFYDEYDRVVEKISSEYHEEMLSTIELSKKYNISTQRIDSIFKSLGISHRSSRDARLNTLKKLT